MKNVFLVFVLLMSFFTLATFTSCKSDEPITETERVEKLLTESSWNLGRVTVDGTDQSSIYAGLSLTFTATGYTVTGGKEIWPANDAWSFTDNSAKSFTRGDGLLVTIAEITPIKLVLELEWSTDSFIGGRSLSIKGKHSFVFKK